MNLLEPPLDVDLALVLVSQVRELGWAEVEASVALAGGALVDDLGRGLGTVVLHGDPLAAVRAAVPHFGGECDDGVFRAGLPAAGTETWLEEGSLAAVGSGSELLLLGWGRGGGGEASGADEGERCGEEGSHGVCV